MRRRKKAPEVANYEDGVLRYVVLDTAKHWLKAFGNRNAVVCNSRRCMLRALQRTNADSLWISRRSESTVELAKTLVGVIAGQNQRRASYGDLLLLEPPKPEIRPTLEGLFRHVIGGSRRFKALPQDQLATVLGCTPAERQDVFIGGVVNQELGTLVLVRGNLEKVIVPLTTFRPSGRAAPDFSRFELGDHGQTLSFGEYEATADVVLWEADADYRKRAKVKERARATGFGPSLRRLRIQRGLTQSDFPNVSRKTIARLENGDVDRPHGATLDRVAKALGVAPKDIESY